MHVQEYDGRCQAPNTRRVYVSYLDSVHFFRPKIHRTDVYHEILIGYLDYAKQLGYVYAHIWACPPSEGDDYIFHCHPLEQRVPKPKRLQDWYKKMLDKAIEQEKLAMSQIVCKYFQGGYCHSGNKCKFLHEEEKKQDQNDPNNYENIQKNARKMRIQDQVSKFFDLLSLTLKV